MLLGLVTEYKSAVVAESGCTALHYIRFKTYPICNFIVNAIHVVVGFFLYLKLQKILEWGVFIMILVVAGINYSIFINQYLINMKWSGSFCSIHITLFNIHELENGTRLLTGHASNRVVKHGLQSCSKCAGLEGNVSLILSYMYICITKLKRNRKCSGCCFVLQESHQFNLFEEWRRCLPNWKRSLLSTSTLVDSNTF